MDKLETEFHKRTASNDGLAAKCKTCAKAYDDARANLPCRVEGRIQYAKSDKGKLAGDKAKHKWSKQNPAKRAAQHAVNNAVRDSRIEKSEYCVECGKTDCTINGHHDDYARPLDVRWLCSACHSDWHKQNGPGLNA